MPIRVAVYVIAALLVGAHFLRAANYWLVAMCVVVPFIFFHRSRFSLVVLQVFAYAAAGVWLQTAWELVQLRLARDQNWKLAAAILGAIALYSLLAGLLLNSNVMRRRYDK